MLRMDPLWPRAPSHCGVCGVSSYTSGLVLGVTVQASVQNLVKNIQRVQFYRAVKIQNFSLTGYHHHNMLYCTACNDSLRKFQLNTHKKL